MSGLKNLLFDTQIEFQPLKPVPQFSDETEIRNELDSLKPLRVDLPISFPVHNTARSV